MKKGFHSNFMDHTELLPMPAGVEQLCQLNLGEIM